MTFWIFSLFSESTVILWNSVLNHNKVLTSNECVLCNFIPKLLYYYKTFYRVLLQICKYVINDSGKWMQWCSCSSPSALDHRCQPNAVVTFNGKTLEVRAVQLMSEVSPDNVNQSCTLSLPQLRYHVDSNMFVLFWMIVFWKKDNCTLNILLKSYIAL